MENNPAFQKMYEKAAQYCSAGEHCRSQVKNKLRQWNAETVWTEEILSKLEAEDFLNEDRYAELFVRSKVRQNSWGKLKIVQALRFDKVREESVQRGWAALDENLYLETLRKVLQKAGQSVKAADARTKEQKIFAHAASKGFEPDLIRKVFLEMK